MNHSPRILYFFKHGRDTRLTEDSPREFLYGYPDLVDMGCNVELMMDSQVDLEKKFNKIQSAINTAFYIVFGIPGWSIIQLWRYKHYFNEADLVFVSTNTFGLALGVLCRIGIIRSRIMYIAMGLVESSTPKLWRYVFKWALRDVKVLTLAQTDAKSLSATLDRQIPYLPFGVDKDFWLIGTHKTEDYVLSIGNDRHRDYETLLSAWKPEFPQLLIVTSIPLKTSAQNIKIIKGDWHRQILTDIEIRALMQKASFIVLPIKQTTQPSGQSSALQAMACGKTVLITNFLGLWNRNLMLDGVNCIFTGIPGDVNSLSAAVSEMCKYPDQKKFIGSAARRIIENELNTNRMALYLYEHMESFIGRPLIAKS